MRKIMRQRGFTLIEIVIALSLVAMLGGVMVPMGINFFRTQKFEEQTDQVIAVARMARNQALLRKNDSAFGVKFFPTYYVLFEGGSYAGRVVAKDERFALPSRMFVNQSMYSDEIRFGKSTGIPSGTKNIYLTYGDMSKTVSFGDGGAEEISQTFIGSAPTDLPMVCYSFIASPHSMTPTVAGQELSPAWSAVTGALVKGDGSVATASNAQNSAVYLPGELRVRNFKDTASWTGWLWNELNGIVFDILVSDAYNAQDVSVRLMRTESGVAKWSDNKALGQSISVATSTWFRYGSPTDLWGMRWAKADINAMGTDGFGFDFAPQIASSSLFVSGVASTMSRIAIDGAVMTLCYKPHGDPCGVAGTGTPSPMIISATTVAQDVSGVQWGNLNGAKTASDGSEATVVIPNMASAVPVSGWFDPRVTATQCVPTNATITGVTFVVRTKSDPGGISSTSAQPLNDATLVGNSQTGGAVPTSYTNLSYCGAGACNAQFSPSDINTGKLGLKFSMNPAVVGGGLTAYLDGMTATITYTVP